MARSSTATVPRHHRWLYALPDGRMPSSIMCNGVRFEHVETFKHDFFAATGLYRGPRGLAVLKMGRRTEFLFFSLRGIGRFFIRREARFYADLASLRGIPGLIGMPDDASFLHDFVAGHPLERREPVNDAFFDELRNLLGAIHGRGCAYVDLNKRQNILVGDDGHPYLIDFQIALRADPAGLGRFFGWPTVVRLFQRGDHYHYCKHKRRLRPDLLTQDEQRVATRLSPAIRLHRLIARPFTNLRRRVLQQILKTQQAPVAGSAAK